MATQLGKIFSTSNTTLLRPNEVSNSLLKCSLWICQENLSLDQ